MSIEAMKLALDALSPRSGMPEPEYTSLVRCAIDELCTSIEQAEKQQFKPDWDVMAAMVEEHQRMAKRIEKFEQAEKQEPVAWMKNCADFWEYYTQINEAAQEEYAKETKMWIGKLRTAPPQREWMEQERAVGYREGHQAALKQRVWQGLTDQEINILFKNSLKSVPESVIWNISRAIEAKLKEKNT